MQNFPVFCYDREAAKKIDELAIAQGLSGEILMKRAAVAALAKLRENWPAAKKMIVMCGVGNNAGDGLVLARLASEEGMQVEIFTVDQTPILRNEAQNAFEQAVNWGIPISSFSPEIDLNNTDLIIDAIFGIGLSRKVTGAYAQAIEAINRARVPVFSIDIPSGLCPNTGQALGCVVKATATITFIVLKQGLLTNDGPEKCGELFFDSLGVAESFYQEVQPSSRRMILTDLNPIWVPRNRNAHKGFYGHVLVIGGNQGFAGAVRIAAEAAARVGAGLVSIATHPDHAAIIAAMRPEIMSHGVGSTAELASLLESATVIAIGPGLRQDAWGQALFKEAITQKKPKIVDADALNELSKNPQLSDDWILTPHPGEAARLLNCSTMEIQSDRFAAVKKIQQKYGGVVVLKGCGTIVVGEDQFPLICDAGNPGMATGGMGDLLTGILAGLVAQKLNLKQAAVAGVLLHALAADDAAEFGERGLLASDLLEYLREWVN